MAAEKMDVDKAVTNGSITNGDNKDNNKEKTKAKAKTNANLSKEGIAKKKKKYGSLFGAGDPLRSHANVQSELRPMAHLLYNLGLGLVRETVYGEIIKNKKDCVDLTAKEQSHRDKMQKSHVSLVEKNTIFPKPQKSSEKNIKAYKDEYITNSNKAVSICSLCEKKFQGSNKNYDFAIHMIQIHKRKPRKHHESLKYRCNLCCYESSVRKTFTRHTKRCQAKFTLKINLRQNPSDYEMPIPSQHKSFNINKGINNTSPSVKSINRNPRPASGRDRLQINNSQQQQQQQNQLQRQQTPGKIQGGQSMLKNPTAGQIISVQGKLYTIFFRNGQRLLAPIRNQMPTKEQMNDIMVINGETKDGRFHVHPSQMAAATAAAAASPSSSSSTTATGTGGSPGSGASSAAIAAAAAVANSTTNNQSAARKNALAAARQSSYVAGKSLAANKQFQFNTGSRDAASAAHLQRQAFNNSNSVNRPLSGSGNTKALEVCEICGGFVRDRHSLRTHFFYAHKLDVIGVSYPNREPNLQCVKCTRKFWTIEGRRKHEVTHMSNGTKARTTNVHRCTKCFKDFPSPTELKRHSDTCMKLSSPIVID